MADEYLRRIVESANAGKAIPTMRVVAGNTLFVGQPGDAGSFADRVEYGLGEEYFYSKRVTRRKAEGRNTEAVEWAQRWMQHLRSALTGADSGDEVLTLLECQVWPASGGDGMKIPVVRIPLDAVDGWWFGAGTRLKAPSQGGGWLVGFGVVFPIDGDG